VFLPGSGPRDEGRGVGSEVELRPVGSDTTADAYGRLSEEADDGQVDVGEVTIRPEGYAGETVCVGVV
jgi:hypothetical protein